LEWDVSPRGGQMGPDFPKKRAFVAIGERKLGSWATTKNKGKLFCDRGTARFAKGFASNTFHARRDGP